MSGIFGDYDDYVEDQDKGLYGSDNLGDEDDPPFADCDLNALLRVRSLRAWISDNETNKGNRYFLAKFDVVEIYSQEVPEAASHNQSEIIEGGQMAHLNKLPKYTDPDMIDYGEQKQLDEALSLGSALVQIKKPLFTPSNLDAMCEDDGARVREKLVGIDVESETQDDVINGTPVTKVFYNTEFYPVDQTSGERVPRKTPEQIERGNA